MQVIWCLNIVRFPTRDPADLSFTHQHGPASASVFPNVTLRLVDMKTDRLTPSTYYVPAYRCQSRQSPPLSRGKSWALWESFRCKPQLNKKGIVLIESHI